MPGPVIAIEAIIGAGKTTLTKTLAEALDMRAIYEPVESNPYLTDFYANPKRWAFPMQIALMANRLALQQLAAFEATAVGGYKGAILDRSLSGDRVFCKLHYLAGNISKREWQTYEKMHDYMTCNIKVPSLVLFLDVEPEVALERIRKRARTAEVGIDLKYLRTLRRGYLDLMVEIESNQHVWSSGISIQRVAWNSDHQPIDTLVDQLKHRFRL